jgi:hypothetical protein
LVIGTPPPRIPFSTVVADSRSYRVKAAQRTKSIRLERR